MKKTIYIKVENEIASLTTPAEIVCGNKQKYEIEFSFDEGWSEYPHKTARFFYNGTFEEVIFTGNICEVPIMSKITGVFVGVFAGDLATTTPAFVPCRKSILCLGGTHVDPPKDVYDQIMALINKLQIEKGLPSDNLPLVNGEAAAGESREYSRADHVHPTDETRASAEALTAETERATAAEEANAAAIEQNAEDIAINAAAIAAETERATAAEEANAAAIGKNAENIAANAAAIAAETERARAAESDLANTKQDNLSFDGVYNADTNKAATVETVARKIAEVIADAPADFDTLKEFADWLSTHGGEAAKMNSDIKKNTEDIAINAAAIEKNAEDIATNSAEIKLINETANSALGIANTTFKSAQTAESNSETALLTAETTEAALTEEIARATAAEEANAAAIAAETERATSAEEANAAAIAAETERATSAEEANAAAIAAETERATAAEAKCVQQKEYSNAEYNPTFDDGDCARAYVRSLNGKEESILVSKYTKSHAIPLRNEKGNLFTLTPTGENECANKKYVDDEIAGAKATRVNPDYRENDNSKLSHVLHRPAYVSNEIESYNDPIGTTCSGIIDGLGASLGTWRYIGYPMDYVNAELKNDINWYKKFIDDIGRYTVEVEYSNNCNHILKRGTITCYLSDATIRSVSGGYVVTVKTGYSPDACLVVIYDVRKFNDDNGFYTSFDNVGVYLGELLSDCDFTHEDTSKITRLNKMAVRKLDNALVDFAASVFLQMNLLKFKKAIIPPSGTFNLRTGMIAIVFPWDNNTMSIHTDAGTVLRSIGPSLIYVSDEENLYYDIAAVSFKGLSSQSSHDTYRLASENGVAGWLYNSYTTSGTETGNGYIYYLERKIR